MAEGKAFATKIKAPFVETSAVKNGNIGEFLLRTWILKGRVN